LARVSAEEREKANASFASRASSDLLRNWMERKKGKDLVRVLARFWSGVPVAV
jgi:hypothetical protein